MMKSWTKRLGRKSLSSDKSRKSSSSSSGKAQPSSSSSSTSEKNSKTSSSTSTKGHKTSQLNHAVQSLARGADRDGDRQIRPEAFDVHNTGVSSRGHSGKQVSPTPSSGPKDFYAHLQPEDSRQGVRKPGQVVPSDADSQGALFSNDMLSAVDYRDGGVRRGHLDRLDGFEMPQRHNSSRLEVSAERQLEQLPSFEETAAQDQLELFFAKINQCNVMFNFTDPGSDIMGKEIKRVALCELIDFISESDVILGGADVYEAIVGMFTKNVIRSIPPHKNPFGDIYDPDDDEPVSIDAWPHMSLVYEFFLRFIDSPNLNVGLARQYIDQHFILSVIELFDSEDPHERDYLKTTLHRIYGKFLSSRPFIRKSINNVFLQFVYETGRFNGIAELLEIFGSVINGFAIPLKEEHKIFLRKVLIPLHTARSLGQYHSHLTYCIVQFLEKDPTLTSEVVLGLLRYWPKISSPKEILFLLEFEDIFDVIEPNEFKEVIEPVFTQLAKCIASPHGQVAERALCNWTHEYFATFVVEHSDEILPILFPALCENSGHWNRAIHSMVHSATKMFLETNPVLYEKCASDYREQKQRERESKAERQAHWKQIEEIAKQREVELNRKKSESIEKMPKGSPLPPQSSAPMIPPIDTEKPLAPSTSRNKSPSQQSNSPVIAESAASKSPPLSQPSPQAQQTQQAHSPVDQTPQQSQSQTQTQTQAQIPKPLAITTSGRTNSSTVAAGVSPTLPYPKPTSPSSSGSETDFKHLQPQTSSSSANSSGVPSPTTITAPLTAKSPTAEPPAQPPTQTQGSATLSGDKHQNEVASGELIDSESELKATGIEQFSKSIESDDDGFVDAQGHSPTASPLLMSCPSSPE